MKNKEEDRDQNLEDRKKEMTNRKETNNKQKLEKVQNEEKGIWWISSLGLPLLLSFLVLAKTPQNHCPAALEHSAERRRMNKK